MGKRVLIAPLNWGFGHATRCIPVIQLLLKRGHTVFVASDGDALELLKREFPALTFFQLPGYGVKYSIGLPAWLATILKAPALLRSIRNEHRAIETIVQQQSIDVIISDNRYGCWSAKATSVFLSHQLNLPAPKGWGWSKRLLNFLQYRFIKRFHRVWVPDQANRMLSGELSGVKFPVQYVGVLSRFQRIGAEQSGKFKPACRTGRFVVVLSGPEPQRSVLEKIVLPQVVMLNEPSVFIRGMIHEKMGESEVGNVQIINYVDADGLAALLRQTDIVVARSGYSTVMDLAVLGKKAIFIPTPGQPEQEYLARKFLQERIAFSVSQNRFDLADALEESADFTGFQPCTPSNELSEVFDKIGL